MRDKGTRRRSSAKSSHVPSRFVLLRKNTLALPKAYDEVLLAYDEAHGKNVASAADVKISSRLWAEHFGDIAAANACDLDRIEKFKTALAEHGYTPGYVNRVLSVGRAALMRAYERRLMTVRPVVKGIPGYRGPPKGRPLTLAELKRFYKAVREPHFKAVFDLGPWHRRPS